MAPKNKRKAADESTVAAAVVKRAAKAAEQVQIVQADNSASTCAINAKLQSYLTECDSVIKGVWKDLMSLPTSTHSETGVPIYDAVTATRLLSSGQSYLCAVPFYWLDPTFDLQPNVPKYRKRLENLRDHFFSAPVPLTQETLVRLNPGDLPHKMAGTLRATDLPEIRDALRIAVAEALQGPDLKRKEKQAWKDALQAIPVRFEAGKWGEYIAIYKYGGDLLKTN